MLLCLENDTVPVLEEAADAIVVVLREAIELMDNCVLTAKDFDLVTLCCSTPLCGADGRFVECEGVAATYGFPPETAFSETNLSRLFAEVEEDVVDALAGRMVTRSALRQSGKMPFCEDKVEEWSY